MYVIFIIGFVLLGFLFVFCYVSGLVCILLLLFMAFFLLVFLHFVKLIGFIGIVLIFIRIFGQIPVEVGISLSKALGLLREGRRINLRRLSHLKSYAQAH